MGQEMGAVGAESRDFPPPRFIATGVYAYGVTMLNTPFGLSNMVKKRIRSMVLP